MRVGYRINKSQFKATSLIQGGQYDALSTTQASSELITMSKEFNNERIMTVMFAKNKVNPIPRR